MTAPFPHITSEQKTPEVIDELASQIGQVMVDHPDLHDEGLKLLGALLYATAIPNQVAHQHLSRLARADAQTVADLAEQLRDLLLTKVLDADRERAIDPARLADGQSFCGWVRNFATSAAASEYRNLRRDQKQSPVASLSQEEDEVVLRFSDPNDAPEAMLQDRKVDAVINGITPALTDARPLARVHLQAGAILGVTELPPPIRPAKGSVRAALCDQLDADPQVAYRVVDQLSRGLVVDNLLAGVFAGYDRDQLQDLIDMGPLAEQAAAAIARAAASGVPPVPIAVAREMRLRLTGLCVPGSGQTRHAKRVVTSWAVARATIIGDEYNRAAGSAIQYKSSEQIARDTAKFESDVQQLLDAGLPGFASAGALSAWLDDQARRIMYGLDEMVSAA